MSYAYGAQMRQKSINRGKENDQIDHLSTLLQHIKRNDSYQHQFDSRRESKFLWRYLWLICRIFIFIYTSKEKERLNIFFTVSYVNWDWIESNHSKYSSDRFIRFSRKVMTIQRWISFYLIFVVYLRTDRNVFSFKKGSTLSSIIPLDIRASWCQALVHSSETSPKCTSKMERIFPLNKEDIPWREEEEREWRTTNASYRMSFADHSQRGIAWTDGLDLGLRRLRLTSHDRQIQPNILLFINDTRFSKSLNVA